MNLHVYGQVILQGGREWRERESSFQQTLLGQEMFIDKGQAEP